MKTVVGLLKTRDEAQFAIYDLVNCGFQQDAITLRSADMEQHAWSEDEDTVVEKRSSQEASGVGSRGNAYETRVPLGRADREALIAIGIPEADARYYEEGVARGGYLLTVQSQDGRAEEAAEILRRHGALEDERGDSWRGKGWSVTAAYGSNPLSLENPPQARVAPENEPLSHATLQEQLERAELFEGPNEWIHELPEPQDDRQQFVEDREFRAKASSVQNAQQYEVQQREIREGRTQERELERPETLATGIPSATPADYSAMDDAEFERHFRDTYGMGERFDEPYRSAYHFAEAESSSHPDLVAKDWYEAEADIHRDWEMSHPGTWSNVENAIHFGWDRFRRHH
jgi:hypothetical protein